MSVIILCAAVGDAALFGSDFQVYYLAGHRVLTGAPIYQFADGPLPFKYHPTWALAFAALSVLPEPLADVLFNTVMVGCWIWAARLWARWLGYDIGKPTNFLVLLLISLNALSKELAQGQDNGALFLGATLLVQWLSARPQRWFAAGGMAAVLCSVKLNFGLLAVFCLIRNPRSLLGIIAGALAVHAATAVFYGDWLCLDLYRSWLRVLLTQSAEQYTLPDAQGALRFYLQLAPSFGRELWLATTVLAVVGGVVLERSGRAAPALIASYWLAAAYLLSPLAWWHQVLFVLPLAFFLLKQEIGRVGRGVLFASLAIYALASRNLVGPLFDTLRNYQAYFIASAGILAVMVMHLWSVHRAGGAPARAKAPVGEAAIAPASTP